MGGMYVPTREAQGKMKMTDHKEILKEAAAILSSRGNEYGDMKSIHEKIANIATLTLNKTITAYDVAMILHAVKLGRIAHDRSHKDSFVDGVNYLAFAAELADPLDGELDIIATAAKALKQHGMNGGLHNG
jgi:hypothetical protein